MLRRLRQVLRGEDGNNNNSSNNNNNNNISNNDKPEEWSAPSPIKLRSSDFKRQKDGSVTLSVTLDKDQVECCVCFSSMTSMIFRCRGTHKTVHNICGNCEWQIRRMKNANGHTKIPRCPICKEKGQFIRNRALERQLSEISIPCKNSLNGCHFRYFPWDTNATRIHYKQCLHEPISCPFCHQSIKGGRCNFIKHLKSKSNTNQQLTQLSRPSIQQINEMDTEEEEEDEHKVNNDNNNNNNGSNNSPPHPIRPPQIQNPINNESEENNNNNNNEEKSDINDSESNTNEESISSTNNNNNNNNNDQDGIVGCCIEFIESELSFDNQQYATFSLSKKNTFVVFEKYGYVLLFLAPNKLTMPAWRVFCVSISPFHEKSGNNRVYLTYTNEEDSIKFLENEQNAGLLGDCLMRPVMNTLTLTIGRLSPTALYQIQQKKCPNDGLNDFKQIIVESPQNNNNNNNNNISTNITTNQHELLSTRSVEQKFDGEITETIIPETEIETQTQTQIPNEESKMDDESISTDDSEVNSSDDEDSDELELFNLIPNRFLAKSSCTPLQCGYIFSGDINMNNLHCRVYSLEESLKVGAIIDARDFTGKWYQAEIIKTADHGFNESSILEDTDPLEVRRVRIHYLGYSANYDEWLNVDTDSHRIAQRGTYTVGPDLRAIRRHANQHNHNNQHINPMPHIQVPRMLINRQGNNNNNNNSNNNNDSLSRHQREERDRIERELTNSIRRVNNNNNNNNSGNGNGNGNSNSNDMDSVNSN